MGHWVADVSIRLRAVRAKSEVIYSCEIRGKDLLLWSRYGSDSTIGDRHGAHINVANGRSIDSTPIFLFPLPSELPTS
jgi:hypothetical protein